MAKTPPSLTGQAIREQFLNFYAAKQHKILPSASLVPEDPTVLLTIAGMLPFKPIFLGQKPAPCDRATTSQKCIRTNDIENVGRTARHHTFFEMLGNFSFGDYFKEQAIAWAWELSTEVFQLPPERLVPSVFRDDDEAFAIWRDQIGIPAHRIQRMGEEDNFWKSGPTGPCGPCSEIYYDFHPELGDDHIDLEDDTRFIEFYNLVFMQYNRDAEGNLTPLAKQNIDTGMGLERMAQILQQVPNNYETDLIFPIIETAANIAGIDYYKADQTTQVSLKVIGDHVRSVMHMIADGITASNTDRGYILRRLIRRVVRHGRLIGIEGAFINQVLASAIAVSESAYPNVRERQGAIEAELTREEAQFLKTLSRGEKMVADILAAKPEQISGVEAFTLYDTYGFPLELTQEIAEEQGITVDVAGFEAEMELQRDRARQAHETIDLTVQESLDQLAQNVHPTAFLGYTEVQATAKIVALLIDGKTTEQASAGATVQIVLNETPFYAESGGQIGDRGFLSGDDWVIRIDDVQKESGMFIHYGRVERGTVQTGTTVTATIDRACRRRVQANHSATHLLQAALKLLVDPAVSQAGSLVDFNRLRFDFNLNRAVSRDELAQIEAQINTWIAEAHDADVAVMPIDQAKAKGATAMFGEKYGADVRVIDFPGVSMELCGGTHVRNTAEIGAFKVISEAGISSGVRRIEAVAGPAILDYLAVRDQVVRELSDRFKAQPEELIERVDKLQTDLKATQKELEAAKGELAIAKSDQLLNDAETVGDFKILVANLGDLDPKALQTAAERLQQKLGESAVVLASTPAADKVSLVAAFSPQVNQAKKLQAGKFIGGIAKLCGGGGGGRPHLAQAGGRDASQLPTALDTAKTQLRDALK
ncbi:alanine--tRNA ligase [Spirulina major CS-329]|uniref:alanine--tRNA ligase n=1 Tax=Spirulina TaxID=1154 RepID=UPI00232FACBC|nr:MULTISPECIES: alanine--tRNA ligase [Spirulina]MDB9494015.1 alanine--tRNA ligase [Spirulina subsalsa CS-330]MDB9502227.1 alanine--tRNA ligase [Spirulina major CS-329]